jgi:hypothetical protein
MNTTTTPQKQVIELLDQTIEHVGFSGYLFNEDFTTFEEVRDLLEDNGAFNVEVIY